MVQSGQQQAVVVARHPDGMPIDADFSLVEHALPRRGPGELLLRVLWLSLDPYLFPLLCGRHIGRRPMPGEIVPGIALAEVIESDEPRLPPGTRVVAETGWCEVAAVPADAVRAVDPDLAPGASALGVLGQPGLTAWVGMRDIARPQAGEVMLVSAAAGVVGSVAGQLAKAAGCRVVGIAGTRERCDFVVDAYGFDACIARHDGDFPQRLRQACPDGIDMYFDNAGGPVLEAALGVLRRGARIVLCGLMDQYGRAERPPGPNLAPLIGSRARMEGLVVYDHLQRFDECVAELAPMLRDGRLRAHDDVADGLGNAPAHFIAMLRGQNLGKSLVRVAG